MGTTTLQTIGAEFSVEKAHRIAKISGRINPGDLRRFLEFVDANRVLPYVVSLDSPGGDVAEALRFGKWFSYDLYSTQIGPNAHCYSACTILWAGGSTRDMHNTGVLGFHRLSLAKPSVDLDQTTAALAAHYRAVEEFYKSVGFPKVLVDKMSSTPPSSLFLVTGKSLSSMQIGLETRYDPHFLDVVIAQCGKDPASAIYDDEEATFNRAATKRFDECLNDVSDTNRALRSKARDLGKGKGPFER